MATTLEAVRAEALFASCLQSSQRPDADQVRDAVSVALREYGTRGCASLVAGEYGEHPDTAVSRMSWALATVREVYTTPPDTPVAALPGRLTQRLAYCA